MTWLKKVVLTAGLLLAGFGVYAAPTRADEKQAIQERADRPTKVDLWDQQSPVADQDRRGTCVAHSTVAALEAAYKRAGYEDLDLSEEFTVYATKMFWLEPNPSSRAFATENKPAFLPGGFGAGYVHQMAAGFAVPTEADMPYRANYPEHLRVDPAKPKDDNPLQPNWAFQYETGRFNLDPTWFAPVKLSKATYYGVTGYRDVSGRDTDQIEAELAAGREVVWDFLVPKTLTGSRWVVDLKNTGFDGGHSVLIVGYDRTKQEFLIKNSWKGASRVRATYEFVRKYGTGAVAITEVTKPRKWEELAGLGRWYVEIDGKKGVLDVYHMPGMAKNNFAQFKLTGTDGKVMADHRVGTFFLDGSPLKAYRVNGTLHKDGVSIEIDWENPNQKYDATGEAVRLKFTGAGKGRMTGPDATAVRLTSPEAFDRTVPFDQIPEVKGAAGE